MRSSMSQLCLFNILELCNMATLVKACLIGDLDGGQTGVLMTVLIKGINQDGWSIRGNIIDVIFIDSHRRKEATA